MSAKKKVLIICRSSAGQMYLGVLLNRIWYAPVLAKTPEEGLGVAQKTSVDMVVFDGDVSKQELMPAVTLLRTDPSIKKLPLIVFMSVDSPEVNQSLLTLGCAAVLTKPLDLSIVYGILARVSGQPRTTPRVQVKMKVEIEEGTPEKTLSCVNLSEGGVYLRTLGPVAEGTMLHIRFTLPHDAEAIELAAEVVRTLSLEAQFEVEPGMGLRFIDMPKETLLRIRNFIQWELMGDLEWKSNI